MWPHGCLFVNFEMHILKAEYSLDKKKHPESTLLMVFLLILPPHFHVDRTASQPEMIKPVFG